jgi:ectoine hydroxylase-related dioxygenase (phytanoyl-CoA dioxygenase family)
MTFWEGDDLHCDPASREHLRKKDAKLLDLHHVSDAIQAIVFAEPIQHFLEILFERPALAFQSLGFYYGTQQPTHQDCAFVRVNSPLEFVASWIALEDITPGSGELEYYPGSHRLPHYFFGGRYLWFKGDEPQAYQFFEHLRASAERANLSKKRFIAKKGDVLIWSASLMHGGSPVENVQLTRKSLVSHYCPADLQPMFAYGSGRLKQKSVHGQYIMAEH